MDHKIVSLRAENIKRLKAVAIKPDGNLVVIGGKNGAGKTSVLDAITYAMAGGKSLPSVPIRRGEDKASVVLDLGDLVVKRTFTADGGTSLAVTNKEGAKYPSPQAILDGLVGRLSFDPLEFSRQVSAKQSETLRALVGLNLEKWDAEYDKVYQERTALNREVKQVEAQLVTLPAPKAGLPDEESSAESILKEQQLAAEKNKANANERSRVQLLRSQSVGAEMAEATCSGEVKRLKKQLENAEATLETLKADAKQKRDAFVDADAKLSELRDVDLFPFTQKIREIEGTNKQIRENKKRNELQEQLKAKRVAAEQLSDRLDAIAVKKAQEIAQAKYPVDGLSVAQDGEVLFNGLPLSQASSAEQLRVSVAIGLALNPKLRVLLIRDGSLLDEDSLKMVADMAAKAEAQVWLERVGTTGEVSVVIEDGMVSASSPEPSKPQPQPKEELTLK